MSKRIVHENVDIDLSDDNVTSSGFDFAYPGPNANHNPDSITTYYVSRLNNISLHAPVTQLLISDKDYAMLAIIHSVLCAVITFSGCLGNAVTIATYLKMKLKDGVMILFLYLAVSDFLYGVTMLAHLISVGLSLLEIRSSFKIWFPIDPFGIYVFFSDIGVLMYLMTVLATTFIAIIRCLCIAKPLQFRNILTKRMSFFCTAAFSVAAVASYLPILLNMYMEPSFDRNINATRYRLRISPQREEIKMAIWISRDFLVTIITEIVVFVCVVIMTRNLRAASKFRSINANYTVRPTLIHVTVVGVQDKSQGMCSITDTTKYLDTQSSSKFNSKDFSVVHQVVLISFVYIVCNMPKVVINLAILFVPDLAFGKPYQNVYFTIIGVMELFQAFNSSFNIFIYSKYNSKFRRQLCLVQTKALKS